MNQLLHKITAETTDPGESLDIWDIHENTTTYILIEDKNIKIQDIINSLYIFWIYFANFSPIVKFFPSTICFFYTHPQTLEFRFRDFIINYKYSDTSWSFTSNEYDDLVSNVSYVYTLTLWSLKCRKVKCRIEVVSLI